MTTLRLSLQPAPTTPPAYLLTLSLPGQQRKAGHYPKSKALQFAQDWLIQHGASPKQVSHAISQVNQHHSYEKLKQKNINFRKGTSINKGISDKPRKPVV